MDHLGRYISQFDLPPDVSKRQVLSSTTLPTMKNKISKAVKRIMTNEDVERFKEDLAWQMAEMVVTGELYESFVCKRALVKYQSQNEVIKVTPLFHTLDKNVKF